MNTEAKQAAAELNEAAAPILRRVQDSSARLTKALREALRKWNHKAEWSDVRDRLAAWIESANVEGLAEWLDNGGWEKLTPDAGEIEARFMAAWGTVREPALMMAPVTLTDPKDPESIEHFAMLWAAFPWIPRTTPKELHGPFQMAAATLLEAVAASATDEAAPQDPATWDPSAHPYALGLDCLVAWMSEPGGRITLAEDCLHKGKKPDKGKDWLAVLAWAWLAEQAAEETKKAEAFGNAVGIMVRPIARTGEDEWTTFPRGMDSAAAMAGPITVADPVSYNGETYGHEPEIAAPVAGRAFKNGGRFTAPIDVDWKARGDRLDLRPRGVDIVPKDWLKRPMQMTLALDMEKAGPHVLEYMIETATKTAILAELPNMTLKMLGFLFASAPASGRACKGTLLDLSLEMYSNLKERRQPKDLETVAGGFVACGKGLQWLDEKPDGTKHPYDIWTVDYDLSTKPTAVIGYMMNPWLAARLAGKGGGFFILNMSRWKHIPITNTRLFPLILRLAAIHDRARVNGVYDPRRLPWIDADRLAFECNTLPDAAQAYRFGKTDAAAAKTQLTRARANIESDLDEVSALGLLGKWKKEKVHGRGFQLLPIPAEDYPAACLAAVETVKKNSREKKKARKG